MEEFVIMTYKTNIWRSGWQRFNASLKKI